jgi:hypothetical protein
LDRFVPVINEELDRAATGGAVFKAIRGEYGAGKTFLTRWLAERAKSRGMAASEVQISETDTPPHRYQTIYRRLVEQLSTASTRGGALKTVVDSWFFALEDDVLKAGTVDPSNAQALLAETSALMERRLGEITRTAPAFAAVLRAYLEATTAGDHATAEGLLAWLGGQPHVAASVKRSAGIKGDLDHDAALSFLAGLLTVLRDAEYPGLVVVLDEVETMQRMRSDTRDKGLEALRKFIDDVYDGRFPGLYLVITGTSAFFDGPQGVQRLAPLAQRLHTDFSADARFDNPRAVQVRRASTLNRWSRWDARCEISLRRGRLTRSGSGKLSTIVIWTLLRERWQGSSVIELASLLASTSRSWSVMYSIGSNSTPTSTRAVTTS